LIHAEAEPVMLQAYTNPKNYHSHPILVAGDELGRNYTVVRPYPSNPDFGRGAVRVNSRTFQKDRGEREKFPREFGRIAHQQVQKYC
jgi:hypothetical protein